LQSWEASDDACSRSRGTLRSKTAVAAAAAVTAAGC
jgi:hypothetical protein